MGGEGGLAICYIISGGLVKLLYNVIWGRGVLKIDIFCYIICGWPHRARSQVSASKFIITTQGVAIEFELAETAIL